jgi:hypothetical protein
VLQSYDYLFVCCVLLTTIVGRSRRVGYGQGVDERGSPLENKCLGARDRIHAKADHIVDFLFGTKKPTRIGLG